MEVRPSIDSWLRHAAKHAIWRSLCRHAPSDAPDVVVFSTGRSGGTWLMETIGAEPGMRTIGQPLSVGVHDPLARRAFPESIRSAHGFVAQPRDQAFVERFFRNLFSGRIRIAMPWSPRALDFHRRTHRVVVETTILKAWIGWFSQRFPEVKIVYLVRHPAPWAMSTMKLDWIFRSASFLDDPGFTEQHLTSDQLALARDMLEGGEWIEKLVTSWCIQNLVPLRLCGSHPEWTVVTYEELVAQPEPMAALLADRLELQARDRIKAAMDRRSRTSFDAESADVIERATGAERKSYLLGRWRERLSSEDKDRCSRLLEAFGIVDYRLDRLSPASRLLNLPATAELLDAL